VTLATDDHRLLIGDDWVKTEHTYEIVNPATEQVVGLAPEATVADAQAAARAARDAFDGWAATPMAERCRLVGRAGEALAALLPGLVPLVQAETGSTITVAEQMQLPVAVQRFAAYALPVEVDRALPPQLTPTTPLAPGSVLSALVVRQPVGVVAAITPYNFPLTSVAGKIAPALAMGNTVVIKPAPQDPLTVHRFAEVLAEIFPPGVVNLVTGSSPALGAALVDSPDVDMISFTGSSTVGVKIAEAGAKTMKRLLMELGGKGACVVFDDADIAQAVTAIVSTWAFHAGQICTAPTRVIAQRGIYPRLVEALAAAARGLKLGDPLDRDTLVGPLVSRQQRDSVERFIARGRDDGAELVVGGERPDRPGWYVAPTLFAGARPDMFVAQEEAFGPVVVAMEFDDEDDAVAKANDSHYGLFSYVFSGDTARGLAVARRIRSGMVGVNNVQPHHGAPFGGFKMSGIGRDRGVYGLEAYSELQAITWGS
jgi:acyl-CoA reductase-like NAD-dependent aldehyde dehydrogenase